MVNRCKGSWGRTTRVFIGGMLISCLLALSGCDGDDSEQYYPLAHDKYTMAFSFMFMSGTVDNFRVDGTEIDGVQYDVGYNLVSKQFSQMNGVTYFRRDGEGVYSIKDGEPEQLYLPVSLEMGASWTNEKEGKAKTVKTVQGFERVMIRDTTYEDCLVVAVEETDAKGKVAKGALYYAPGVGLVKESMSQGGMKMVSELIAVE